MDRGPIARQAALDILRRVRAGHKFDTALTAALEGIRDPDRSLAHEIAAGVLRCRTDLDRRLMELVSGRWNSTAPDLKDLLRIGVYQLTRLERVPDHGAVQSTVEVAKRTSGRRAAAFVNAVLRRVARSDLDALPPPAATSATSHLADEYSHPIWLVDRWLRNFGREKTLQLLEHNNRRPNLVIQPVRWSAAELRGELERHNIPWSQGCFGKGIVVTGVKPKNLPGFHEGAFVVQDPAQGRLLEHASIPEGALVWDVCASPGGKAAILGLRGPLVATDIQAERIARLRDNLKRIASSAWVVRADAIHPPFAASRIDVTLVDAPCSATGSLQRHPDGRWRLSEQAVKAAARYQATILDGVSRAVRLGGLLVYLTCSLEPEENHELIDQFIARNRGFCREGDDLFIFPPGCGTDGGFVARMRRVS